MNEKTFYYMVTEFQDEICGEKAFLENKEIEQE